MRDIKFRGKRFTNGEWVYGSLISFDGFCQIVVPPKNDNPFENCSVAVIAETVGQFSGLTDKNGKEVYDGDILRWYTIDIEYQTHYGDNIPLGSYTEPCGTECKKFEMPVIFRDAMFTCNPRRDPEEDQPISIDCPIQYPRLYDRKELNHIFYPRPHGREHEVLSDEEFLEAAQLCAEELGFQCASIEEFIQKINGFEVVGNIYEHSHLIK